MPRASCPREAAQQTKPPQERAKPTPLVHPRPQPKYWLAFKNVYDFVFSKYVNLAGGGEWYERIDRQGAPIDDALGHAWKCGYHTVRSMIQTTQRLRALANA
jgi:mannose/cellobiose epimerase-like protein (N-acyl-D-glucosamine 2-epimerase family)